MCAWWHAAVGCTISGCPKVLSNIELLSNLLRDSSSGFLWCRFDEPRCCSRTSRRLGVLQGWPCQLAAGASVQVPCNFLRTPSYTNYSRSTTHVRVAASVYNGVDITSVTGHLGCACFQRQGPRAHPGSSRICRGRMHQCRCAPLPSAAEKHRGKAAYHVCWLC